MPWTRSHVEDRTKFIEAWRTHRFSMRELCHSFQVSRKTAYKFVARYREFGKRGLEDRSRARKSQPMRTSPRIESRVVEAAQHFGCWGPRKIIALLKRRYPSVAWPSKSTAADILARHGLTKPQRKQSSLRPAPRAAWEPPELPNDLWCTDFKGWSRSGLGERLEPFTLGDAVSRFALACTLVRSVELAEVWPIFVKTFREYGLPKRIRADRGPPFFSRGLAKLSRLSIRWLRLGIHPECIDPGKPQQNGMIERFNLTVAIETMSPPQQSFSAQQRELRRFVDRFNHVRPHEALRDRVPADVYTPSPRRFPKELPEFSYPTHMVSRRVQSKGDVRFGQHEFFLGEALAGEQVGFEQISACHWSIRLGPLEVAIYDEASKDLIAFDELVFADDLDAA